MSDSDFNSGSSSSSRVVSIDSLVVDNARELGTKSHNDYSTFGRTSAEPTLHASPLTTVVAFGNALGVPVYGQYGTMVGLAERSHHLFSPAKTSSSRPAGVTGEGEAIAGPSRV